MCRHPFFVRLRSPHQLCVPSTLLCFTLSCSPLLAHGFDKPRHIPLCYSTLLILPLLYASPHRRLFRCPLYHSIGPITSIVSHLLSTLLLKERMSVKCWTM